MNFSDTSAGTARAEAHLAERPLQGVRVVDTAPGIDFDTLQARTAVPLIRD